MLEQNGGTIKGHLAGFKNITYSNPEHPDLQIEGSVTAAGDVTFGCAAWELGFEGRWVSAGRMEGQLHDCANGCRYYGEVLLLQ